MTDKKIDEKDGGMTILAGAGGAVVAATAVTEVAIEASISECDGGGDGDRGDGGGCGGGCGGCSGGCGGWNQDMTVTSQITKAGEVEYCHAFLFLRFIKQKRF